MTQTTAEAETDDLTHEQAWTIVLAEYWRQTDWDQFGQQQKARADTFGERLTVASRQADVHGALDKLARGLGMSVPDLPTVALGPLVADETAAMETLGRERVWLVNKTNELVTNYFAARKRGDLDDDASTTDADADDPTTTTLSDFAMGGDN